jgi:excisionase family DNA binding protein
MSGTESQTENWLSLSKAAKLFNVHPTTLRRWADQGEIQYMLTPGGHRRFSERMVNQFLSSSLQTQALVPAAEAWVEKAMVRTRRDIQKQENVSWLALADQDYREQHRALGRKLMGLTLQYISGNGGSEHLLDEARKIGREYGRIGRLRNMPLTVALEASIFFRDRLIEVALELPESTHIRADENIRLMNRINTLLNAVHLSVAKMYETV